MRFAQGPQSDAFEQPDYDALGGVGWQWPRKLKSRTRFTNSENRKEGLVSVCCVWWVWLIVGGIGEDPEETGEL